MQVLGSLALSFVKGQAKVAVQRHRERKAEATASSSAGESALVSAVIDDALVSCLSDALSEKLDSIEAKLDSLLCAPIKNARSFLKTALNALREAQLLQLQLTETASTTVLSADGSVVSGIGDDSRVSQRKQQQQYEKCVAIAEEYLAKAYMCSSDGFHKVLSAEQKVSATRVACVCAVLLFGAIRRMPALMLSELRDRFAALIDDTEVRSLIHAFKRTWNSSLTPISTTVASHSSDVSKKKASAIDSIAKTKKKKSWKTALIKSAYRMSLKPQTIAKQKRGFLEVLSLYRLLTAQMMAFIQPLLSPLPPLKSTPIRSGTVKLKSIESSVGMRVSEMVEASDSDEEKELPPDSGKTVVRMADSSSVDSALSTERTVKRKTKKKSPFASGSWLLVGVPPEIRRQLSSGALATVSPTTATVSLLSCGSTAVSASAFESVNCIQGVIQECVSQSAFYGRKHVCIADFNAWLKANNALIDDAYAIAQKSPQLLMDASSGMGVGRFHLDSSSHMDALLKNDLLFELLLLNPGADDLDAFDGRTLAAERFLRRDGVGAMAVSGKPLLLHCAAFKEWRIVYILLKMCSLPTDAFSLLSSHSEVVCNGWTVLIYALISDEKPVYELMVSLWTSLMQMATPCSGRFDLLTHCDSRGTPTLLFAHSLSAVNCVLNALCAGRKRAEVVNAQCAQSGDSLLITAVQRAQCEVVRYLFEQFGDVLDVNLRKSGGSKQSALMVAIDKKHAAIVTLFVDYSLWRQKICVDWQQTDCEGRSYARLVQEAFADCPISPQWLRTVESIKSQVKRAFAAV